MTFRHEYALVLYPRKIDMCEVSKTMDNPKTGMLILYQIHLEKLQTRHLQANTFNGSSSFNYF